MHKTAYEQSTWTDVRLVAQACLRARIAQARHAINPPPPNQPATKQIISQQLSGKPAGFYQIADIDGVIWCTAQDTFPSPQIKKGSTWYVYVRVRSNGNLSILEQGGAVQ